MRDDNNNNESKELEEYEQQKELIDLQKQEAEQMSQIAKQVVDQVEDDRDKADELYDFMRDQIEVDNDKNPSTRDAMSKALELKMKGGDQMIELLKIKGKLFNPNKNGMNVNVNIGNYDEKKGGDTNDMIDIADQLRKKKQDNSY